MIVSKRAWKSLKEQAVVTRCKGSVIHVYGSRKLSSEDKT